MVKCKSFSPDVLLRGVEIPFPSELGGSSSLLCTLQEADFESSPSSTPNIQTSPHPLSAEGLTQHILTLQTPGAQKGMEE